MNKCAGCQASLMPDEYRDQYRHCMECIRDYGKRMKIGEKKALEKLKQAHEEGLRLGYLRDPGKKK